MKMTMVIYIKLKQTLPVFRKCIININKKGHIINKFLFVNDMPLLVLKMNMQGITCRIREKNGKYKATIKAHKQGNKECSIEKTKEVLDKYDDSLFSGMHLKLQGSLRTERVILYSDDKCEAVLDKNIYLGMTDYELEVEYLPEHEEQATILIDFYMSLLYPLKQWSCILSQRVSKCKSERFFEHKKVRESFLKHDNCSLNDCEMQKFSKLIEDYSPPSAI